MLLSMHKFRADPKRPNECSLCGRKVAAHDVKVRCPSCNAPVSRVAGVCPTCGQLVGVEPPTSRAAPPTVSQKTRERKTND
jgi:hypothetical protein